MLLTELQPRGRLEVVGAQGGVEGARTGPLPRLARLTEAISGILDDYTMVRGLGLTIIRPGFWRFSVIWDDEGIIMCSRNSGVAREF